MYYITELFNSIADFLSNVSLSCGVVISCIKCIFHFSFRGIVKFNISKAEAGSIASAEAFWFLRQSCTLTSLVSIFALVKESASPVVRLITAA